MSAIQLVVFSLRRNIMQHAQRSTGMALRIRALAYSSAVPVASSKPHPMPVQHFAHNLKLSKKVSPISAVGASPSLCTMTQRRSFGSGLRLLARSKDSDKKASGKETTQTSSESNLEQENLDFENERQALKENLRRQEQIHNMVVPERNWGLTHPMTFVMFVLICVLHYMNTKKAERKELEEFEEMRRVAKLTGEGRPYVEPENQGGWE
eukprot:CFRG5882T1